MIGFDVPGKPFAKQRPRATRQGRIYTPKETVSFERSVAVIAQPLFPEPLSGPIRLEINAFFQPPNSWSKKKAREHLLMPHTQRPDLDNIVKAIKDALNRIAWADDSQVAEVIARKEWGIEAATCVTVAPYDLWRDGPAP